MYDFSNLNLLIFSLIFNLYNRWQILINIKEKIIETGIINLLKILKTKVNCNFKLNIKFKYELIPNKSKIEHY